MANAAAEQLRKKQPNILILFADQMRADAMGCAGNSVIRTPNLDRLSNEGVRFENASVAFPLCSPFRASLFTGKYPHTNGQCANHFPIPLGQDFLAEILRDNGYHTAYFGKWHLDGGVKPGFVPPGERRLGFETFVGFNRGHFYDQSIYYRDTDQPYHCPRHEPDFQTDHFIDHLDTRMKADKAEPFFAMVAYGPPHGPLIGPDHYLSLYSPEEMPIPDSIPQDDGFRGKTRKALAEYYGLVANIDFNVGRILNALDRHALMDDTLILFMSDHGEMAGEHGLFDKKVPFDSSMRVPFIVRYPKRFGQGVTMTPMVDVSVDTMPALLELLRLPVPEAVQGTSFLSLLDGDPTPTREEVYYEITMQREGPEAMPIPERGIRTLDWLYVRTPEGPKYLFDRQADPLEMVNLVEAPHYEGKMEELDALLQDYMERTNDSWDIEAVFPPPNFMTHEEGAKNAKRELARAIVEP